MPTTISLEVGQAAPEFRLKGPGGQFISLSEYRGSNPVVVVFYPLAFSPVCSHQLPEIEKRIGDLRARDAVVFGISVDSHYANTEFANKLKLSFPLLSDFSKQTSIDYGVLMPETGYSGRATFIIDKNGVLAYKDHAVTTSLNDVPSVDAVLAALDALKK